MSGSNFTENYIIIISQKNDILEFGKVENILYNESAKDVIFVIIKLKIKQYCTHICAYQIEDTSEWSVLKYENLIMSKKSFMSYMLNSKEYVSFGLEL